MKKTLKPVHEFVTEAVEKIQIGQYEIRKLSDGSFWIEHESGEGMQCKADSLEAAIEQFYADNF